MLPPLASIPARPAIATTPHAPVAVAPSAPVKAEPNSCCCWPIGEPRTKTFRFCDGTSIPGKPYCEEHSKRAYVRAGPPGLRRLTGNPHEAAAARLSVAGRK